MDDGKKVWAPHPTDGFIQGQIVDITSDSITVETFTGSAGNKTIEANYDRVYPSEDDDTKDVDDNCALMYLNEATLLNNVRLRYKRDQIYTYVANILIAVNPYREIKNIYCVDTIRHYKGKSIGVMPPHVFAIADKAYRDMRVLKESQSIIVSGESGAGKTESTKYVLRYLTENWGSHAGPIEERILQANPLLEAFGNAKTVRNNNSSRFGKFVEIHFSSQGVVDGGYISHYLLEKSRICVQNREERNYHVFYQMCAGAPAQMKQQLRLGSPDQFHYLNRGCTLYFATDASDSQLGNTRKSREYLRQGCLRDPVLDDAADFGVTEDAMRQLGFRDDERRNIYAIVAGVLHLGNVSFEDDEHNSRGGSVVSNVGSNALSLTSAIFGLENDELRDALTARVMQSKGGVKGTVIKVPLKVYEAMNARDALAKAIYAKLFDSIVRKINDCIPLKSSANYIGVLDIAGFEYFPINSFEQFCINYCNEKLQQFFNERILKDEQRLYEYEGLGLRQVNYSDNQDCIDLIEAKAVGIFDLLDEESKLPRPDPANFTASVHQKYPNHFRLSVPRKSRLKEHRELRTEDGFLVRHFAGAVCYQTAQFIEKNNDALHASLAMLLAEANNAFLRALFTEGSAKAASSAGGGGGDGGVRKGKLTFISIGNKFRTQLGSLMEKLRSTGTSFIRCIKPNQNMVGHKFEGAQILSQLQCSGMASVLSLMQEGYPSRAQFAEVYSMYKQYLPKKLANLHPRMFCKALFKALGLDEEDFRFGLTKVFFRPGKFAEFDQVMRSDPEHLAVLVKRVERWLVRSHWKKAQYCAWAVLKLKNKISWRRQQLIVIQKHVKGYLARKKHQPRIRGIMKVRMIKAQLGGCERIIGQLRHDRDVSAAEVADLQRRIDDVMTRIKTTSMTREEIDRAYTSLIEAQDRQMAALKRRLEQQKIAEEQERLRQIEEERERERRRKEEEEQRRRREEEEKRVRIEMEAKRKAEEEAKRAQEERDKKAAEALQAELAQERLAEEARQQKLAQERRDHELATRLAQESGGVVEALETPQLQRSERARSVINAAGGKTHELSKWKYAELRDTINTSCDVALLDACREEFHRRLKVYHEWKSKNKKAAATENQRAPQAVIENSQQQEEKKPKLQRLNRNIDKIRPNVNHRFFRLPFLAPADMNREPQAEKKGWWYAHFDGQWIARQLELYPDKQPVLLIAGTDDMQMCELSLEETGLTRKRGAEILARQFEDEWKKLHGGIYVRPSSKPR